MNEIIEATYTELPMVPENIREAISFTLAVCEFDATPFREQAKAYVAKYQGLEFTEEDVKIVSKIIADLNKKSKEFEIIRKDIKKEFNKPLDGLEKEIATVTMVYNEAVLLLKTKLDVFEQKYIREKTLNINTWIVQAITEYKLNHKYAANITLLDKYLNKTETKSKITKDLAQRCEVQFTYQENERLAKEAEAERLQRRMTMLNELNANYKGRIVKEVTYVATAHMSDEQLQDCFAALEIEYAEKMKALAAKQLREHDEEENRIRAENEAARVISISPTGNIVMQSAEPKTLLSAPAVAEVIVNTPPVKWRYLCEITTTAEQDTILPALRQMKSMGIVIKVIKRSND